jgi:arylsulfatase A-like enzyme
VTDLFNQHAIEFLKKPPRRPWLLYLSHKAVHPNLEQRPDGSITDPLASKFEPAEQYRTMYADAAVPHRPNTRDTLEGKPALTRKIEGLPPLGPGTGTDDETVRNRLRMLMSVEEGVGRILDTLKQQGQLDDTIVVFTSDHGYFYGEHGLSVERRLGYEETIRVPLLVQYPRRIKAGATSEAMVQLLDLAPTLLELAGAPPLKEAHGLSLVPLLTGEKTSVRQSLLVEHHSDAVFRRVERMGYHAVRTDRWKLIRYRDLQGMDELYDLANDPYEMRNLITDAAAKPQLEQLQAELNRLLTATGAERPKLPAP